MMDKNILSRHQVEFISAKKSVFYPHGIVDMMAGKGEYALFEKGQYVLMDGARIKEKAVFVVLSTSELVRRKFDKLNKFSHSKRKVLISLRLKEKDFGRINRTHLLDFFNFLQKSRINFIISRPLPECFFKKDEIKKFKIPKGCRECRELLIYDRRENYSYTCGHKTRGFIFYTEGKKEAYKLMRKMGMRTIDVCGRLINSKYKFETFSFGCYNPGIKRLTIISFWAGKNFKKFSSEWWFNRVGWRINIELNVFRKVIKAIAGKDGWVLDNGGGAGRNSFFIRKNITKKIVLTDINDEFFKITAKKQKSEKLFFPIIKANSLKLPFKSESFSVIYSGGVLHTLTYAQQIQYIKECYRVLKPMGILLGMVISCWEVGDPGVYALRYKRDLKRLLFRVGLKEIYPTYKIKIAGYPQQYWVFFFLKSDTAKSYISKR